MDIDTDYDPELDFSNFKSFDFLNQVSASGSDAMSISPFLFHRASQAIEAALASRGFTKNIENPDFNIAMHAGADRRVNVNSYGYWGGPGANLSEYTEGTLIIDIIDPITNQLAWRGSASGVIDDPGRANQEDINTAVFNILEKFPPK
jgi:hypothetical protein